MPSNTRKRITLSGLRENPERYRGILQTAESFKPFVTRFLAAKKEAERVFENLRHADMDEAAAYLRKHPMSPEAIDTALVIAVAGVACREGGTQVRGSLRCAVVAKYPVIENPMTVQRWVTAWSRGSAAK